MCTWEGLDAVSCRNYFEQRKNKVKTLDEILADDVDIEIGNVIHRVGDGRWGEL